MSESAEDFLEAIMAKHQARAARGLARYDESLQVIWLGDNHHFSERIDPKTKVKGNYQIDLLDIKKPADILAWFAQLGSKVWFKPEVFVDFWAELRQAFAANGFDPHRLPDEMKFPKPGEKK